MHPQGVIKKSNTIQTIKEESKYAKIYSKPSVKIDSSDTGKKTPILEDISLTKESSKEPFSKENDNFAGKSTNEMVRSKERIVLTEDEPIYLTVRSGKRIRIDNENYKKPTEKNHRTLKIRNLIDKNNEQEKTSVNSIANRIGFSSVNKSFLRVNRRNGEDGASSFGVNRTKRINNKMRIVLPMAGVEEVLNKEENKEPIRINSQYDYENYLKEMVEKESNEEFYQKILSSL